MFIPVRQHFPHRGLKDIPGAVQRELAPIAAQVQPGARIAIGVGSRDRPNLAQIVLFCGLLCVSVALRARFRSSFRRWAATAPRRLRVRLTCWRIMAWTRCRWDVRSSAASMSFRLAGRGRGIEVFAGKRRMGERRRLLHQPREMAPSFAGAIESGVSKMMALGLGKIEGAKSCHGHARSLGMEAVIRSVARYYSKPGRFLAASRIWKTPTTTPLN